MSDEKGYTLALYDVNYKIGGKLYAIHILATSFDWAITHVNWKDMKGVTNAQCFICSPFDNLATLSSQHSMTLSTLFELDETVLHIIRIDKKE